MDMLSDDDDPHEPLPSRLGHSKGVPNEGEAGASGSGHSLHLGLVSAPLTTETREDQGPDSELEKASAAATE